MKIRFTLAIISVAIFAFHQLTLGQCPQSCDNSLISIALGTLALESNIGFNNTAIGYQALFSNTTGNSNTATGAAALINNIIGSSNTATGGSALFKNTAGNNNTATGVQALFNNTTGVSNTATV